MGDGANKSGGGGFLPGLVLGVIVGAATAFVALEVLDSPKIDVDPNPAAATGSRIERGMENAEQGGADLIQAEGTIEVTGDAIEGAVEGVGEDLKDAADETTDALKKTIDPPADPSDG